MKLKDTMRGRIGLWTLIAGVAVPIAAQPASAPSDQSLDQSVEHTLRHEMAAEAVDVDVRNGIVVLNGTVHNVYTRDRLLELAEQVAGVVEVQSELTIEPERRSAAEIEQDVRAALAHDQAVRHEAVKVHAEKGVVHLEGTLPSESQRRLAEQVAGSVRGVESVENDLELPASDRPSTEIREEVEVGLGGSVVVNDPIRVTVEDQRVQLAGVVDSAFERSWAIRQAWQVDGVREVDASRLTVNPVQWDKPDATPRLREDDEIRQAIITTFTNDARVTAHRPGVVVEEGRVTLSGDVATLAAKQRAEELTRMVSGVKDVANELVVATAQPVTDEQITRDIRAAWDRSAVVEAAEIDVQVQDGRVTLSGKVDSRLEQRAAEALVARTRGVAEIDSRLRVAPEPEYPTAVE